MTVERGVVTYHNENNIWGFDHVWVKVVWVVGGGMQEESNGLRTQCGGWLRHMTMKGYTKINKDNFELKDIHEVTLKFWLLWYDTLTTLD